MTSKIFRSIISVAAVVLLSSVIIASTFLYGYFNKSQVTQLKEELSLVASSVDAIGVSYFDNFDSSVFRFTLVSNEGDVIYDSLVNSEDMNNHLDREEILEAKQTGEGSSARYSDTLTKRTFYEAKLLDNDTILRISVSQVTAGGLIVEMFPALSAILVVSIVLALGLSNKMSKSIVKQLEELDLEHPTDNDTYEELAPLLMKMNKQRHQISSQMKELQKKSDEFKQITSFMNEGLILLDKEGIIISINEAAKKISESDDSSIGQNYLVINRSNEMRKSIESALKGKNSEFVERKVDKEYQYIINCIESSNKIIGVVILCFDITEVAFAQKNRKEFTANVTHELKTPLQSIIGSVELLETGLAKPEDTKRFINNIKKEATRLKTLINDIIRLSQLDENNNLIDESVDIYEVAKEAIEVLNNEALNKQIDIELFGDSCIMQGIHRYIYEIIYNLLDNAIRYNEPGGKVIIKIEQTKDNIILSVSDTGIGIPQASQSRVFERFYRVDKSHSKDTGGTGLGLSIVKHAVAYHKGIIKLDSSLEKGTTIKIIF